MKYCGQCGNEMQDDMLFCQRCGTRHSEASAFVGDASRKDIDRLKAYSIHFDPYKINWSFVNDIGPDQAGQLSAKQDALSIELVELVTCLLDKYKDEPNVLKEIHDCVLEESEKLVWSAGMMLSDIEPIVNLRNAAMTEMTPERFAVAANEIDVVFRTTATLQFLYAVRIRSALDNGFIRKDESLRKCIAKLADSYCAAWRVFAERTCMFFINAPRNSDELFHWQALNTLENALKMNWNLYLEAIEGLSYEEIDGLNLDGWMQGLPENLADSDVEFWESFKIEMKNQLDEVKAKEDAAFWNDHPELAEEKAELDDQIESIKLEMKPFIAKKESYEELEADNQASQARLQQRISANEESISSLRKKIFGKAKALAEADLLEGKNDQLRKELNCLKEEAKDIERKLAEVNGEIAQGEKRIGGLRIHIRALRL